MKGGEIFLSSNFIVLHDNDSILFLFKWKTKVMKQTISIELSMIVQRSMLSSMF